MTEIIFNTNLSKDGYLLCPKEYLFKEAEYKVIVSFPQKLATDDEIEATAVSDNIEEYLTKEEINYYMRLD